MDINIHIRRIQEGLLGRPGVVDLQSPVFDQVPLHNNRATIGARLIFFDGSYLDCYEIVDTFRSYPQHLVYRYQYVKDGEQIFRYDNSPHHREIASFPHHKHVGPDRNGNIVESQQPSHSAIFDEIAEYLNRER